MAIYLLITAIIIVICVMFNKISSKLGVPTLLAFIVLGMIFGSDGLFKISFENYQFAEKICSVALIFIMFYGGFGTRWSEARPVAAKSILLSTVGVILTAGLTGMFCYFMLNIELLESLLIGSVISSTDAASVFSILRSKKLNLKDNTASILEVESGSNDPCSYMLTTIMLSIMSGKASAGILAYTVFAQLIYGSVIGIIISFVAVFVLRHFKFATEGFDAAFVLAVAILAYAIPELIRGNGYLSAYIVGIVLGNANIKNKQSLVHFFDGITGLMQMLIFFLLGLLAFPSQFSSILLLSVAIALFLTFVARPVAVFLILAPLKCKARQQILISFAGLRGAASIVFAIMATVSEAYTKNDVFHIVFFIVLLSITFQGTLIPIMANKLKMIDNNANVLKTFNDYTEETDVQFIKLAITECHPWKNKELREIAFPTDTLIVMLIRNKEIIVPSGSTMLLEKDIAVLSAPAFQDETAIHLVELKITSSSKWREKKISEFSTNPDQIIVMIKRSEEIIIPRGETVIKENDILVMNSLDVLK
ncbi:potassium/proton antiporter [Clostridium sp. MB40-C1]|uniref:potassium/proton antiporter n=1 Tax=Clostridium sp. MB40-C1 TaxID=3070996 RepID=UPI0027DF1B64|nr:potassium/proton antiporter [Clostridium sp. MB40-C1]WMJ82087.1 potassium/proton antiporter [Clostridium sp. MB40-C1]